MRFHVTTGKQSRLGMSIAVIALACIVVACVVLGDVLGEAGLSSRDERMGPVTEDADGEAGPGDSVGGADTHGDGDSGAEVDGDDSTGGDGDGGADEETVFPDGALGEEEACPLAFDGAMLVSKRENTLGDGWTLSGEMDADDVVPQILAQLEQGGFSLDEAMTLDLFGDGWGCVATSADGSEVLIVAVMPEIVGLSDEGRGDLRITIVEARPAA